MTQCANTREIAAITVTYGKRRNFLNSLLISLNSATICPSVCIVINNGSVDNCDRLGDQVNVNFKIILINSGYNSGPAKGFKTGIKAAIDMGYKQIWLLDDDNVVRPNTLENLLVCMAKFEDNANRTCLASLRVNREKYIRASQGENTLNFTGANSFLGFSFADSLKKKLNRIFYTPELPKTIQDIVPIDFAIFGGLLLHSECIEHIGYPDERYCLYFDDRDYTTRLNKAGFRLMLVPQAIIDDSDNSWASAPEQNYPWLFNPKALDFKVYYTIRNGIYYDIEYFVKRRIFYFFNATVYFAILTMKALIAGVNPKIIFSRSRTIFKAIADALNGRLGHCEDFKLPD